MAEIAIAVADSDCSATIAGWSIALEASELQVSNSRVIPCFWQNVEARICGSRSRAGSVDVRLDQRSQLFGDSVGSCSSDGGRLLAIAVTVTIVAVEPRAIRFAETWNELHAQPAEDVVNNRLRVRNIWILRPATRLESTVRELVDKDLHRHSVLQAHRR